MQNCNNSPGSGIGNGNTITITMDNNLVKAFVITLDKLSSFLNKN
jgi:hypothetical protein